MKLETTRKKTMWCMSEFSGLGEHQKNLAALKGVIMVKLETIRKKTL